MGDLEVRLLLEAIYDRYHYDFRSYAMASLKRRLAQACDALHVATLSGLQELVLHEPESFSRLLQYLTVQVSDMFRDPEFFLALRQQVLPVLATYPSIKIWCAGCSTGEEAYSLAILLQEEGLLDRSIIYATDINAQSLRQAANGVFTLDRLRGFTENHRRSGGATSLSDFYHASGTRTSAETGKGLAIMDAALRRKITFSDHSLATDNVFSEMHLITCRNVLIYFDHALQTRALQLFADSLVRGGFLGLGSKESLRFTDAAELFTDVSIPERIYRRKLA
ncbi:MAG TPA: CheR family methyltransferase [Steroidobacteraceae bacterium]|nr:CheR family methyltransferase [Steroidobacteraceae bacterium]